MRYVSYKSCTFCTCSMTIRYSWSREKLPLPTDSYLLEENRVLIIPNVQVEDAGVYVCHASRGGTGSAAATAQKSIRLNIECKQERNSTHCQKINK